MKIAVVYATPEQQTQVDVVLSPDATVMDAIAASGLLHQFPTLSLNHVGIFSKKVSLDTVLKDGDRVEIYRPLPKDPKEARRERSKG
jgi:putative ubiquitin-RnfH superfamily antitoxin RatB of RatAB toxin-antitoxin module